MARITLELPDKLAAQLRAHKSELPRILRLGLKQLQAQQRSKTKSKSSSRAPQQRKIALQALANVQAITLPLCEPQIVTRHNHPPIRVSGKPASEMIIEDRGPR